MPIGPYYLLITHPERAWKLARFLFAAGIVGIFGLFTYVKTYESFPYPDLAMMLLGRRKMSVDILPSDDGMEPRMEPPEKEAP